MRTFFAIGTLIIGVHLLIHENFWIGLVGGALLGTFVFLIDYKD